MSYGNTVVAFPSKPIYVNGALPPDDDGEWIPEPILNMRRQLARDLTAASRAMTTDVRDAAQTRALSKAVYDCYAEGGDDYFGDLQEFAEGCGMDPDLAGKAVLVGRHKWINRAEKPREIDCPTVPPLGKTGQWDSSGNKPSKQPAAEKLKPLDMSAFLSLNIPPREMMLDPIIPEKGLAMLYASRGVGKTHIGHGAAFAVATAGRFLRWTAPRARRVLIVDGEMPASQLQERLREIAAGTMPPPGMLNLLPADLIDGDLGNLADPKVQQELDPWLGGIEFLILDNLSSLTTVIRDNDAESWNPIQAWLLRLRRRGTSVLIVHHAGKDGRQRGTSRREDVLDTVISLRRPTDYKNSEGARFEVHLEKCRGIHGSAANPFEARLEAGNIWTIRDIADAEAARVAALIEDGMSVRDIADETGIPKSTVGRIKKQIEAGKAAEASKHRMGRVSQ